MSLLAPAALLLAALAIPILLLYMLKLRRRDVPVSSTLLWEMVLRDRQANAPWQRLRRNLLLILQLLILAALVFALARPALQVPSLAAGSAVILLDASASMQATDVAPTRFEAAKAAALALVEDLPGDARVTVVLAGPQPETLAAAPGDRAGLREALRAAQPGQGEPDWDAALALAAGAAQTAMGAEQPVIVILSDGGLPEGGLPELPGEVRYLPFGEALDNLAISALALRPQPAGPELFASVTNYGDQARTAILSIYAGTQLVEARRVEVPAGGQSGLALSGLPDEPAAYTARLSGVVEGEPLDSLPLDDQAYAIYRPPAGGRTLLVTPGNLFLRQLLASLPGIDPFVVIPGEDGEFELPEANYDLWVLDGVMPAELPDGNLLILNPPPNDLFAVTGVFTPTAAMTVADSPLTEFVDWQDVHILRARAVETPEWAEPLVQTEAGLPLVFAGQVGDRRVAVVTFDLHDSDLPLQVAFPVLFSNLISYLVDVEALEALAGEAELSAGFSPGESLLIRPQAGVSAVQVTNPQGTSYILEPGEEGAIFTQTGELGLYEVEYLGTAAPAPDVFAVNLFSPLESQIAPEESIQIGERSVTPVEQADLGLRELWPWLVALALGVLLLEWWVYHGQTTIDRKGLIRIRRPV